MDTVNRPMRQLFAYLRSYSGQVSYAVVSSILNKVLDLMPPLLVGWVIDTVRKQPPEWIEELMGSSEPFTIAAFLALLAVAIFGFESLFEWMFQSAFMKLAQQVQHDLRMDAYKHLQSREMAFFESHRTGDTLSILNNDINQLESFLNSGFNDIIQLFVLFLFAGAILFFTSWQLAFIGMIPIPLILVVGWWFQRRIAPRYTKVREEAGKLNSRLENNLSGISVIKSFAAEEFETRRVEENSEGYRSANFSAIKLRAVYIPAIRMFIAIGFGGVLLLGSYWVLGDYNYLSVGELVLFSMMIQRLLWPITGLGRTMDNFERARASARRIFGLLDKEPSIQDPVEPSTNVPSEGALTFEAVEFGYRKDPKGAGLKVLKGLNLEVKAGETIGIAGITGSGKSTLIKLLLRFYDVDAGVITVDGKDIRDYTLHDLRTHIALVSQDTYLFHGTIRENIAYGVPNATLEQVTQAATLAQLHNFVATLPEGYDSWVGERGIKLSGGQRQRLSIARAILKDAPILILDEATSSVDTETERSIQQNLDRFSAGRTALVIAHRLSTIRNADRIVVLHEGTVAEIGSHDKLVAQGGIYADLWKVQTGQVETI